jgi:hypothetical protein
MILYFNLIRVIIEEDRERSVGHQRDGRISPEDRNRSAALNLAAEDDDHEFYK